MLQAVDRKGMEPHDNRSGSIAISVAGRPLEDAIALGVRAPLVSFVLICWNYAQYVGEAIASIKAQDYPHFECLVIDNGSRDASGDEIRRAIGADKRFKFVIFDENLGQLSAALWALDQVNGSFVTFVDADDALFSNFASTHVQVHLALPRSVAMTSSNVFEMDSNGGLLTSQYDKFAMCGGERDGFRDARVLPRLSTVSDDELSYLRGKVLVRPAHEGGWCWAPGSASMYRRTVLKFCKLPDGSPTHMRAADTHFNHLAHAIAGTALIDCPLSAYRQHQSNYFSTSETLPGLRRGTRDYARNNAANRAETLECVLANVAQFNWMLPTRYWSLVDQLQQMDVTLPDYNQDPHAIRVFTRYIAKICEEFGHKSAVKQIMKRFDETTALSIFREGLPATELPSVQRFFRKARLRKFLATFKRRRRA